MPQTTLHYIYDPLCGWCYASAALVKTARDLFTKPDAGLDFVLHGGGMMAGTARQLMSPQLSEFIRQHDARAAAMTGQPYGDAYTNGLLRDPTVLLDSEPPTTAILAVQAAAKRGADMLVRVQKAHWVEGRRIAERAVLVELAADIGVSREAFDDSFDSLSGAAVQAHMNESRRLLERVGGQGFPTFVLERNGQLDMLDFARYLTQPDGWRAAIEARVAHVN